MPIEIKFEMYKRDIDANSASFKSHVLRANTIFKSILIKADELRLDILTMTR